MKFNYLYRYTKMLLLGLSIFLLFFYFSKIQKLSQTNFSQVSFVFHMEEVDPNCHYQAKEGYDFMIKNCELLHLGEYYLINGRLEAGSDNKNYFQKNFHISNINRIERSFFSDKYILSDFAYLFKMKFSQLRDWLTGQFFRLLKVENAKMALGLVLGRKAVNSTFSLDNLVTKIGLAHMVAVSGFHLQVVFVTLAFFLGIFLTKKFQLPVLLLGLLGYCFLVGTPLSVVRALIMLIFSLMGRNFFYKQTNHFYFLFLAFVFMSLLIPFSVFDVGFQLSFLATAGILLFAGDFGVFFTFPLTPEWLDDTYNRNFPSRAGQRMVNLIKGLICVSLAAQLATLPVLIKVFLVYSQWSILATVLFSSLISLLVVLLVTLGLLLLLGGWWQGFFFWVIVPFAWSVDKLFSIFNWLLTWYSQYFAGQVLFKTTIPDHYVAFYYFILGGWAWYLHKRRVRHNAYF